MWPSLKQCAKLYIGSSRDRAPLSSGFSEAHGGRLLSADNSDKMYRETRGMFASITSLRFEAETEEGHTGVDTPATVSEHLRYFP